MTGNADGTERILGALRSADCTGVVRMEDRLHAAVEDVWSALTDPSQLAHWYGEVNGDLRLGVSTAHASLPVAGKAPGAWTRASRSSACW